MVIIFSYFWNTNAQNTPADLLTWRSFCDMGLAVRFLLLESFSRRLCGESSCAWDQIEISADNSTCKNSEYGCIIEDLNKREKEICGFPSTLMEFCEMASEAWFFCLALDLYFGLSNPFSSFKDRVKYYHMGSWSFAILFALLFYIGVKGQDNFYGFWSVSKTADNSAFCWVNDQDNGTISTTPFVFFYAPIFLVLVFCSFILYMAYKKLKKGISSTFEHRMRVLVINCTNILVFFLYWLLLLVLYIVTLSINSVDGHSGGTVYKLLLFCLAAKGVADLFVWVLISDASNFKIFNFFGFAVLGEDADLDEMPDLNKSLRTEVLQYATAGIRECAVPRGAKEDVEKKHSRLTLHLSQLQTDVNDTVHSGRLFAMLFNFGEDSVISRNNSRQESVENAIPSFVTSKERASISAFNITIGKFNDDVASGGADSTHHPELPYQIDYTDLVDRNDDDRNATLISVIYKWCTLCIKPQSMNNHVELASSTVTFTEYEPYQFRRVRHAFGVDDSRYLEEFSSTIKERLIEGGASGAFFFFSKGEAYIAKSCTTGELDNLIVNAEKYADHMTSNRKSYITRIFGVYMLRIYGTDLHFFVMNNLFLTGENEKISEKYDIKGSYVKRNASYPRDGGKATCTHCHQRFVYKQKKYVKTDKGLAAGKTAENNLGIETGRNFTQRRSSIRQAQRCHHTVDGAHEPNLVMKDNDLKYKLRLTEKDADVLLDQLQKDSLFLRKIGVMDYSLLIGVNNTEYDVEVNDFLQRESSITEESDVTDASLVRSGGSAPRRKSTLYLRPNKVGVSTPNTPQSDNSPRSSISTGADQEKDTITGTVAVKINEEVTEGTVSIITSPNNFTMHSAYGAKGIGGEMSAKQDSSSTEKLDKDNRRLVVSRVVGPKSYYIGIVDFQQQWTWNKWFEFKLKKNWMALKTCFSKGNSSVDADGLSCVEPIRYQERFMEKIRSLVHYEVNQI